MKKLIFYNIFLPVFLFSGFVSAQIPAAPKTFMTRAIYRDFINLHFDYPDKALKNHVEGKFVLHFLTNRKGQVIQKNVLHSVSSGADSIAMDIFNKILWMPTDYSGTIANREGTFTLKFNRKKFEKLVKKRGYRHIIIPYYPVDKSFRIYKPTELDKQPEAVTGQYKSLNQLIYSQLNYPREAIKQNVSGTVKLSFVIEVNGLPSNIHVVDAVGAGCTQEAVAVVERIRWMPGLKDKKAVRSLQQLKISFSLNRRRSMDFVPSQNQQGDLH